MKKAVITILGLAGGKYDKKEDKAINYKSKHLYYFENDKKNQKEYSNILPLLISKYSKEYKIIPLFTEEAKAVQSKILVENEKQEDFLNIFDNEYKIEDENNFYNILSLVNNTISKYDKVIFDVTHGFRHLPILATISLIMQNIKSFNKIEKILFAKELTKAEKGVKGEYEIIDLKEYLDLANLSFIITNFKDNYTISENIKVEENKYKPLLESFSKFSKDIMALSMNNLFTNTYPNLMMNIQAIKNDFLLKDELEAIENSFSKIFDYRGKKRYITYFELSKELKEKDYLLQSISLLSEAKGFYIKSSMKKISPEIGNYFEEIEEKIIEIANKTERLEEEEQYYNYYQLNQECKKIYSTKKYHLYQKNRAIYQTFKLIKSKEIIKNIKDNIGFNMSFKNFIWYDLRNKLVHANSLENIRNVKESINNDIKNFEKFCITNDILSQTQQNP